MPEVQVEDSVCFLDMSLVGQSVRQFTRGVYLKPTWTYFILLRRKQNLIRSLGARPRKIISGRQSSFRIRVHQATATNRRSSREVRSNASTGES